MSALFVTRACALFVATYVITTIHASPGNVDHEFNFKLWKNKGKTELRESLRLVKNENIAKNIILLVGSGLDATTVNAARIYKGHLNGLPGEEELLAMEQLDDMAVLKTYSVDKQIAGRTKATSALLSGSEPTRPSTYSVDKQIAGRTSATSALVTGVGTNDKTLGVNGRVTYDSCSLQNSESPVSSILEYAKAAGKATGIVTTGRVTQGAAAAAYATAANDAWEGDIAATDSACDDIASQLVNSDNQGINVVMGGGRNVFLDDNTTDPINNNIDAAQRADGRNLVDEWSTANPSGEVAYSVADFNGLSGSNNVLGLFGADVLEYEIDRPISPASPTLSEMADKAVDILSADSAGFFLLVESARIGDAHHEGRAKAALVETLALDTTLETILANSNINLNETLIVVAGDRASAMSLSGYGVRGNDVLGLVTDVSDTAADNAATDMLPRSVISYLNGPAFAEPRADLTSADTSAYNYVFPSGVPMSEATDTAASVPVYASGPLSFLFQNQYELTYVAGVMTYSACIGEFLGNCPRVIVL